MAKKTDEPSYEQARDELASVVAALESGGLTLEESLGLWERGELLSRPLLVVVAGPRGYDLDRACARHPPAAARRV